MANKIIDGSLEITGQAIFDSSLSDGANEILISNIASKDFVEANPSIESGTVTTDLDSLRVGSNYYTVSGGGSTYTAGTGIDITSDVISIDSSVVALQSDLPVGEYDILLNDSTVTPTSTVALSNIVTGNSTDGYTKYNVFTNPMTTAGDLILGGSSGAPSRLGIGTSGQVLTSNGTTASWQTPSASGMSNPMTTAGDIIYGASSGTPTRLAKGTAGQVLTMNSGATAPEWQSISIPNVVQDLTSNTAGTLDWGAWTNLKSNHYATISSPTMTGLDSTYEFVSIKLSISNINQFVKLNKNTTNKYSGLFFIEESSSLYEISVYYNGTNIILRCAQVY